jgi:hypothetical protein
MKKLNLWSQSGCFPRAGDVSLFLQLTDIVVSEPNLRPWVLRHIAYPLQNPGAKMPNAPIIRGPQGTGKSLWAATVAKPYGVNASWVGKSELKSSFNGWAANKQLVIGEEITGGGGREFADQLKNLITGQTYQHNQKYQPTMELPNTTNFIFLTNRMDAFHLDDDDRRFTVCETASTPASPEFYRRYGEWLALDGGSAVHDYLLKLELGSFNPYERAPMSKAKERMIAASRSQVEEFVHELKTNPDAVSIDAESVEQRVLSLHTAAELLSMFGTRKGFSTKALTLALTEAGFETAHDGTTFRVRGRDKQEHIYRLWMVRNAEQLKQLGTRGIAELYSSERSVGTNKFSHPKRRIPIGEAQR